MQCFNWKISTTAKRMQGIILMKWNPYKNLFKTNSSSWIAAAVNLGSSLDVSRGNERSLFFAQKNPRVTLIKQLSKLSFRNGFSISMSEYSVASNRALQKMWDPGSGQNSVQKTIFVFFSCHLLTVPGTQLLFCRIGLLLCYAKDKTVHSWRISWISTSRSAPTSMNKKLIKVGSQWVWKGGFFPSQ